MRGTLSALPAYQQSNGIIPAYAGNTAETDKQDPKTSDHPRICGEHFFLFSNGRGGTGSSPHMRGTLLKGAIGCGGHGIIPAYAGNTIHCRRTRLGDGDHPRICGEHQGVDGDFARLPGSSPHMRGTPLCAHAPLRPCGIIPAYAGNTCSNHACTSAGGDHPRICGEHVFQPCLHVCRWGSSPHMRGTLQPRRRLVRHAGIIPAYAGNTMWLDRPVARCWDHPRICGEHRRAYIQRLETQGSSPHMRGTQEQR